MENFIMNFPSPLFFIIKSWLMLIFSIHIHKRIFFWCIIHSNHIHSSLFSGFFNLVFMIFRKMIIKLRLIIITIIIILLCIIRRILFCRFCTIILFRLFGGSTLRSLYICYISIVLTHLIFYVILI